MLDLNSWNVRLSTNLKLTNEVMQGIMKCRYLSQVLLLSIVIIGMLSCSQSKSEEAILIDDLTEMTIVNSKLLIREMNIDLQKAGSLHPRALPFMTEGDSLLRRLEDFESLVLSVEDADFEQSKAEFEELFHLITYKCERLMGSRDVVDSTYWYKQHEYVKSSNPELMLAVALKNVSFTLDYLLSNTTSIREGFTPVTPSYIELRSSDSGVVFEMPSWKPIEHLTPQIEGYRLFVDSLKINGERVMDSPKVEEFLPKETFFYKGIEQGAYEIYWRVVVVPTLEDSQYVFTGVEYGVVP